VRDTVANTCKRQCIDLGCGNCYIEVGFVVVIPNRPRTKKHDRINLREMRQVSKYFLDAYWPSRDVFVRNVPHAVGSLIPSLIDQNPCVQSRRPRDMMRQG
jgi:hypothetical protein